ncbi:MAG: DUF2281 domain-containing protein [Anaerolineae bacterium]|nr:DUF2281 domain-containing protein [Anaerolineae bacterium]
MAALNKNALAGEEIVITRDDQPGLKITRINQPGRRRGSAKGQIKMSEDFDAPLVDFAEYMR